MNTMSQPQALPSLTIESLATCDATSIFTSDLTFPVNRHYCMDFASFRSHDERQFVIDLFPNEEVKYRRMCEIMRGYSCTDAFIDLVRAARDRGSSYLMLQGA